MEGRPPPPGGSGSLEAWERAIGTPTVGPRRRPVGVTVAGVLLLLAGGFATLAGILIVSTGDGASIEGIGGSGSTIAVAVTFTLAAVEIASGVLVLRVVPIGRALGIAAATLGIVGGLAAIATAQGLVTIGIFGAVLFALITNADAFRPSADG